MDEIATRLAKTCLETGGIAASSLVAKETPRRFALFSFAVSGLACISLQSATLGGVGLPRLSGPSQPVHNGCRSCWRPLDPTWRPRYKVLPAVGAIVAPISNDP